MNAERLISFAKKLPGFYGYRPTVSLGETGEIGVEELIFRLFDDEEACEYSVHLFVENQRCTGSWIDVCYSDGSVARVLEKDPDFQEIVQHRNQITQALNQLALLS